MPQDGSNNYYYPPGTPGIPDQTIESEAYNAFLDDLVEHDLNIPRPVHRGGTGANNATEAIANLGGEKSSQVVTNYDDHQFLPGSFYSAITATAGPVASHAFAGWVVTSDPPAVPIDNQNVILFAVDQTEVGRVYTREKKAGVWGPWRGSTSLVAGVTPPLGAQDSALWWDSDNGMLYINYNDGNTTQWVQAVALPSIDTTTYATKLEAVLKTGGVMTGLLQLSGDPTAPLHAVTKQYVDAYIPPQAISIGGAKSFDIAVPPTAKAVRVSGIIIPTTVSAIAPHIQISLVDGVFRTATADYLLNGFLHDTASTPTAVINILNVAEPGIRLTNGAASIGASQRFDGSILLKRPATPSLLFTGDFYGASHAAGVTHAFLNTQVQAVAGSELAILALRILSATGDNWADGSFVKMEWM